MNLAALKIYKNIRIIIIFFSLTALSLSPLVATATTPPLFDLCPTLTKALGYLPLAPLPTAIQKIPTISPYHHLFFKTETHLQPFTVAQQRRLEFIFGEALYHKAQGIMTVAWADSIFAHSTLLFARSLGLTSYYLCRPDNHLLEQNRTKINALIQEGVLFQTFKTRGILEKTMHTLNRQFKKDRGIELYFIYEDGENEAGALGFVNAALELKKQIQNKEIPEPSIIFFIANNAADIVGLLIGLQACALNSRVTVINTNMALKDCLEERVKILFECTKQYLFEREELFPLFPFPTDTYQIRSCEKTQHILQAIVDSPFLKKEDQETVLIWNTTSFDIKDIPW